MPQSSTTIYFITRRYCGICSHYLALVEGALTGSLLPGMAGPPKIPLHLVTLDIDQPANRAWKVKHHLNVPVIHFPTTSNRPIKSTPLSDLILAGMEDDDLLTILKKYAQKGNSPQDAIEEQPDPSSSP